MFGILFTSLLEAGTSLVSKFAVACQPAQDFAGFPTWYKYLDGEGTGLNCSPIFGGVNDVWLIVLAIVELLIRIAVLAAIIFVIVGGIRYMLARGNPEQLTQARGTVVNALVGLAIAVVAVAAINFIGARF